MVVPYACYLRVYEPLTAFGRAERAAWERYLRATTSPDPDELVLEEQRAQLTALAAGAWLPPPPRQDERRAYVLEVDGAAYVCPIQRGLRAWLALDRVLRPDAPRDQAVHHLLGRVLPSEVMASMSDRMRGWRGEHADTVSYIQTARWRIPMAWFLAFGEEDRLPATDRRGLRYRTRMVQARQRMGRARGLLQRSLPQAQQSLGLREVGSWLEEFHPHSRVELDYGGLVELVDDAALERECSPGELAKALEAVRDGDLERAASIYAATDARWRQWEARRRAS